MNGNVTMSVRSVLVAALVALALVVAYLLGGGGGGGSPAQAAETGEQDEPAGTSPRLTMTGTGEATAVPDQLSFDLGVTLTRPDLDSALDAASATMERVLGVLEDAGVSRKDVQTTGLSMSPVYDYHPYGPPTLTGYRVGQRASVLVRDLKEGGAAVGAAVESGGDDVRVSDLRLLVGDDAAVMEQARDAAVAEATAKAEQYAAAAGQELGDVLTLKEVRAKPVPTPAYAQGAAIRDLSSKAVPIRAGKETGAVTVQVVWELAGS